MRAAPMLVSLVVLLGATASSSYPAPFPEPPSIREMIRTGTTAHEAFPILVLGRVSAILHRGDGPAGREWAVVRVRATPVGATAARIRVAFTVDPDDPGYPGRIAFAPGERWAMLLVRRDDGFEVQEFCGRSRTYGATAFRNLLDYARAHA